MASHSVPRPGRTSDHSRLTTSLLDLRQLAVDYLPHDPVENYHARQRTLLLEEMERLDQMV